MAFLKTEKELSLKGKSIDFQSISNDKHLTYLKNFQKPLKLIPILRYKKA